MRSLYFGSLLSHLTTKTNMKPQCGVSSVHHRTKPFSTTMYTLTVLALVLAVTVCTTTEAAAKSRSLTLLHIFDSTTEVVDKLTISNTHVYTIPTNALTIFLIGISGALTIAFVAYTTFFPADCMSCSSTDYQSLVQTLLPLSSAPLEDLPALVHFATASIPPPVRPQKMRNLTPRLDHKHKSASCRLLWTPSVVRESPIRKSLDPPKIIRGASDVILTFGTDKPEVFLPMLRNSIKSEKKCTCPCGHHSPPFLTQRKKTGFALNAKESDSSTIRSANVPPSSPCTSGRNSSTGVSIEGSNSCSAVDTGNYDVRRSDVTQRSPTPQVPRTSQAHTNPQADVAVKVTPKVDIAPQASIAPQFNVVPQINFAPQFSVAPQVNSSTGDDALSNTNTLPQTHAVPPVNTTPTLKEGLSAIMMDAESLKGITIIPAGEEFNYAVPENNDLMMDFNHPQVNEVQAYDVSEEGLTIPLDDTETIEEENDIDIFDIEKGLGGPRYTMSNDVDHPVLTTLVTTTTTTTTTMMTTTLTGTGNKDVSLTAFAGMERSREKESATATVIMAFVAFMLWMLESLLFGSKNVRRMITKGKDRL